MKDKRDIVQLLAFMAIEDIELDCLGDEIDCRLYYGDSWCWVRATRVIGELKYYN